MSALNLKEELSRGGSRWEGRSQDSSPEEGRPESVGGQKGFHKFVSLQCAFRTAWV